MEHDTIRWRYLGALLLRMAPIAVITVSLSFVLPRLLLWDLTPDFSMLWTGGRFAFERPADLYNEVEFTLAQAWVHSRSGLPLPFVYPPSALVLFAPFALLPFWVAYWTWVLLTAIVFWTAARRVTSGWAIPLALVSPQVVLVLLLGQTTLFVGSAVIWGLSLLRTKPFLAGVLLGVAAAVKPQSLLLAPVALVAGCHWRSIAGAAIGGLGMALLSLPFGAQLWLDWGNDVVGFSTIIDAHGLNRFGATPAMAAYALGLETIARRTLQAIGIAIGIIVVWRGFRTNDLGVRILCLVFGSLLASPYAIRYELAMAAPVLAAALLSSNIRGFLVGIPLFAMQVFTIVPALVISLGAALTGEKWRLTPFSPRPGGTIDMK